MGETGKVKNSNNHEHSMNDKNGFKFSDPLILNRHVDTT